MEENQEEVLAQLVDWYEEAEEATVDERRMGETCRDYYDNKQITPDEAKVLKDRGQPEVILNLVQDKVDFLLGFEATTRTDPKGRPRNPQDEKSADAVTDGLRAEHDRLNLQQHFSDVWENMLIEGKGGGELEITRGRKGVEIVCNDIHWDRIFADPFSRKHDYSDARYMGQVVWMDASQAKNRFPEKKQAIENTCSAGEGELDDTYDDKSAHKQWSRGGKRKRVRIVKIYWNEGGQWRWAVFTKGGILEGNKSVPHVDGDQKSYCPMTIQSAYVDRQNCRYGLVKILLSPQDEINKRRSKMLHLLNSNQTIGEEGAVDDVDAMKREKAKPDGHIEINPDTKLEFVDHSQQIQGQVLLMQDTKEHFDRIGPNAAQLGTQGASASGRAIQFNQTSGQIRIARLRDRHSNYKLSVYRKIWHMIQQYKTEQWWVSVTDDDETSRWVGFNRPVTAQEEFTEQMRSQGIPDEEIQGYLQQVPPEQLQQVVRIDNNPAEMDMDVMLEEVPDVANVQQEQFEQLSQLLSTGFQPGDARLKLLIMASSLRDKKKLLDMIEGERADPRQLEAQQRQQDLELEGKEAEIEERRAKTKEFMAKAMKTMTEIDQLDLAEQGGVLQ